LAVAELRAVRGQFVGIDGLLETEAPCPQVLRELIAAQVALHTTRCRLVRHHLRTCLTSAAGLGDQVACRRVLDEVLELYGIGPA
jgi:DNA-binding FrmR family transcriptional regulator